MSSKASEILGVSSKRPHIPTRRQIASRDGDSILSSLSSRRPSNLGPSTLPNGPSLPPPPSRSSRRSHRPAHSASQHSVDSVSHSVRFADKTLASTDSQSTLRSTGPRQPASPSVASSRAAPSAWRGLASRAGGSSLSIGSRTSQESMSTLQSQNVKEPPSRNKTLLRSALSRLTLRPSKSRSTLASARESQVTSTITTATQTAATSRQGTPRAASPSGFRGDATPASTYAPGQGLQSPPPPSKPRRRLNSRMPIEVERPSSRNWYDGLDDADFDDAAQSSYVGAVALQPSRSINSGIPAGQRTAPHFSRQMVLPPKPPSDLDTHPLDLYSPDAARSSSDGRTSRATILANEIPRKRRSKPPEIAPHDYSILNLSDSDDDQNPATRLHKTTILQRGQTGHSDEPKGNVKRDTIILRTAPDRTSKSRKSTPRVLSVLKLDDDVVQTSPSLPSLVESGSSRQTSFISSASQSRFVPLEPITGNNPPTYSRIKLINGNTPNSYDFDSGKFSDQNRLAEAEAESEEEVLQTATRDHIADNNPSALGHVMTALSPEEAAWLAHMRRSRAKTLQKLNPTTQRPEPPSFEPQSDIAVRDFEAESQQHDSYSGGGGAEPSELENDGEETPIPDTPETMARMESAESAESPESVQEQRDQTWAGSFEQNDHILEDPMLQSPSLEPVELAEQRGAEEDEVNKQTITNGLAAHSILEEEEQDVDTDERIDESQYQMTAAAETSKILSDQQRTPGPRKATPTYAEARSRFEKSNAGKSSLPVPKRDTNKGVNNLILTEQRPQRPQIPVSVARLRQYQAAIERTEDDVGRQNHAPPTPTLTSFPQPPGSHDTGFDDMPDAPQSPNRHSLLMDRRDAGARDVLEAWQALGGG